MARTWLSISVELVAGRGEEFWPRPGRVFVADQASTFRDLALAINDAFGRWDRAHLHLFDLEDDQIVPIDWWDDPPVDAIADSAELSLLEPGQKFAYEFDLGDRWEHLCTVGLDLVNPVAVLGIEPGRPMACFGWGELPDQYGRRFRDDGTSEVPPQPNPPLGDLPALRPHWGDWTLTANQRPQWMPPLDWDDESIRSLGGAVQRGDGAAVLELLRVHNPLEVAQLAGQGLLIALAQDIAGAEDLGQDLVAGLRTRFRPGDDLLADELDAARGAGAPSDLRPVPVSLEELSMHIEGDPLMDEGWRIDIETGQWWPSNPEGMIGESPPEHWEDPDAWLFVESSGSRDGWEDMRDFIATVEDPDLAARLGDAIHGRGAFRRFKDVLWPHERLRTDWFRFSDERQQGRAREWLAERGVRPAQPGDDVPE